MRSYKITANLMNKNNIADKTFQQYDYGNKIEFELLEGAQKIDLTGKTILTYWLKNGSTVPIEKSATVNSNGNIEVKTTQELLEVSGELLMQILVSSNDEQARSQVFKFNVEKSLNGDNAIIEDPNYSSDLVTELIQLKDSVRAETIDKIESVDKKIKQIVLHAEDFRESSTMTDDELINNIILNTSNKNTTVLFEKNKNYVFNDYIKIKRSNLSLDFNNSNITLNMNNPDVRKGLFYMYSDSITYTITDFDLYYKNTTSNNNTFDTVSKLVIEEAAYNKLTKGDIVFLSIRPTEPPYSNDNTIPVCETTAKVIEKLSDNTIILDYYSPYDWTPYSSFARCSITIFTNTVRNVTIKNIKSVTIGSELSNFAPVMIHGGENITIENCNFKEFTLPALYFQMVYGVNIRNIYCEKPCSVDNGLGYNIQLISCSHVRVDNLKGDGLRHLIDTTAGYDFVIENCDMPITPTTPSCFDCHGVGEHHIVYNNCIGTWCFGNGRAGFPSINDDITLNNCIIKGITGDCNNKVVINSGVYFICSDAIAMSFKQLFVNNSQIMFNKGYEGHIRGIHRNSSDITHMCIFDKCDFILPNKSGAADGISLSFSYWNNVIIQNCVLDIRMKITSADTKCIKFLNTNMSNIYLETYNSVYIEKCNINSQGVFSIVYHKPTKYIKHIFRDNTFNLSANDVLIKTTDDASTSNYRHFILLENNHINVSGDGTGVVTYSLPSYSGINYITNSNMNTISNGTIKGNYNKILDTLFETI